MLLFVFHFIFLCLSINESQQSAVLNEEYKKVEELEKMLYDALVSLDQLVQESIVVNKSKHFESQLEDLINRTVQIMNNSNNNSSSVYNLIPLSMVKIEYKGEESQYDYNYPGFFVPGNYPTITYHPLTKYGNHPIRIFFYNITNQSCRANELMLTFHNESTVLPSQTIYLNQNSFNATYSINGIDNFDMLEVTVNAKIGESSYTCIPNFILYANSEEN